MNPSGQPTDLRIFILVPFQFLELKVSFGVYISFKTVVKLKLNA